MALLALVLRVQTSLLVLERTPLTETDEMVVPHSAGQVHVDLHSGRDAELGHSPVLEPHITVPASWIYA